jgi:outer membrane immunogenic protein
MRALALTLAAATTMVASPVFAEPWADVHAGLDRPQVDHGHKNGVAYGVSLGYDIPLDNSWFVGLAVSADGANTRQCIDDLLNGGDRACAKANRDLSAVVRAGFGVAHGTKIYALAGYSNARVRAVYNDGLGNLFSDHENVGGLRIGAGVQVAITKAFFAKAEYRFSHYKKIDLLDGEHLDRHNVLVGAGVDF